MSNTKQKIEELRQKLNELEQQLESEVDDTSIKPPSSFKLDVEATSDLYLTDVSWRTFLFRPFNIDFKTLHEKVKSTFELECWVLSNIRVDEKRDYEVYHDGDCWEVLDNSEMPSIGTVFMPERLANILCDKLNSGEWGVMTRPFHVDQLIKESVVPKDVVEYIEELEQDNQKWRKDYTEQCDIIAELLEEGN